MRFQPLTPIVLSLAVATAALASDNLILNGSFSTNLANWNEGDGAAEWSPESAVADGTGSDGSPATMRARERHAAPCCSASW